MDEQPTVDEQLTVDGYTACGCGCCGGVEPTVQCLADDGGKALREIIARDREAAKSPDCPLAGCSTGITYRYCEAPPSEP